MSAENELERRLREGGSFRRDAYASWAASRIEDPDVLIVVVALVDALDRERQRPEALGLGAARAAARRLRDEDGRSLRRRIALLEAQVEALTDGMQRDPRVGELLAALGITEREFELQRAAIMIRGLDTR